MGNTKLFPTADVLSAAGGTLVSRKGIGAIYEVLNWMTGENLFTHQIPRVSREAQPVIASISPDIAAALADVGQITPDNWQEWLEKWETTIGPEIAVPKMSQDKHERIDPLSELAEIISPERIFIFNTKDA